MYPEYFTPAQWVLLISSAAAFAGSFIAAGKSRYSLAALLLATGAFCLFSFGALLDSFLNMWDERFHALVARNMMDHPLVPTLYDDPVLPMKFDHWDKAHVWLHKQPLFMWQMMISFRLFGISEFTARIPSILLLTGFVLAVYRTGSLLVNRRAGLVAAVLSSTSFYFIELIAGRQTLDQNDVSFLSYVSFSLWTFTEYQASGKKKWLVLTGLFSGFAILCKWLTGLLVYSGWGVLKLIRRKFAWNDVRDMLTSFGITILVAAPWQIYTLMAFPELARRELEYNSRHWSEAVEGHGGDWTYHFEMFPKIFGNISPWLLLPAVLAFWICIRNRKLFLPFLTFPFITYLFYTLAETKMPSFTIIAALPVYVIIGTLADRLFSLLPALRIPEWASHLLLSVTVLTIAVFNLNPEELKKRHEPVESNVYVRRMTFNAWLFRSLQLPDNAVLFGLNTHQYVEAMFYSGITSYDHIPNEYEHRLLKEKGKQIVIFRNPEKEIPPHIANDPDILWLEPSPIPTE